MSEREGVCTVGRRTDGRVFITVGSWPSPEDPDSEAFTYTTTRREALGIAWALLKRVLT